MNSDEILKGESKTVEFKSELPKKSEKYMKSIIAFANTSGGRLIIGADDETRAVAEVFSRMELIEEWGTGIRRILKRAGEYGLPEPEFLEIGDTFRVNLFRAADKKPIKKADKKPIYLERQSVILDYVNKHGRITNKEARELLGLAASTTKRLLSQMVQDELIRDEGEKRARIYKPN